MKVEVSELQFIRTSNGRIGVGVSGGEEGGFNVIKWCAPSLLVDADKQLLADEIKAKMDQLAL